MKRIIAFFFLLLVIAAAILAWIAFGSATTFSEKNKYLYVYTGHASKEEVMTEIKEKKLLRFPGIFQWMAGQMDVWEKLKPGRFEIKKGESLVSIVRKLRNNRQSPVRLVINKLRTNEDLAKVIGKNFEVDSSDVMSFILSRDSLATLGVDTHSLMTLVIPNTYNILWNTKLPGIFERLKKEKEEFWKKKERIARVERLGFTPDQVYILASIVEEETNKHDEKGKIASVYINRYNKGMPLGADPTVKFALKDFAITRIRYKHLEVVSPYNTYKNKGLPPGPISTPSPITIDAVLDAPSTEYLFFVAKSDNSGYHTFSTNFAEHKQHAQEYHSEQDRQEVKRQNKSNNTQ